MGLSIRYILFTGLARSLE